MSQSQIPHAVCLPSHSHSHSHSHAEVHARCEMLYLAEPLYLQQLPEVRLLAVDPWGS